MNGRERYGGVKGGWDAKEHTKEDGKKGDENMDKSATQRLKKRTEMVKTRNATEKL